MRKEYNESFVRLVEPEYDTFMKKADTVRWSPADVDYDQIDHSKLTINDVFGVFVTLHIENYSDVYTKLLVESYQDLPLIQKFILNWEREEENHARVLEQYLVALGMPLEELRANYAKVDKAKFPVPTRDQTGLNVFVFLQELFTREMYTKMLKNTKEPVLLSILKRVVRDEERHYRFYKYTLGLRMQLDRKSTLKQARQVFRTFTMPQTMYRQKSMTDQLMDYYQFSFSEMMNIVRPIAKAVEEPPLALLKRTPRLQWLWQNRRLLAYASRSHYAHDHAKTSIKHLLGVPTVSKQEKEYVAEIIKRLQTLMDAAPERKPTQKAHQLPRERMAPGAAV